MDRSGESSAAVSGGRIAQDKWLTVAVALYLMATTVSFASTTLSSRAFIEPVRVAALAAAVGIAFLLFLQRLKVARTTILGVVVYSVALGYGVILATANGGFVHTARQLFADVTLTLTGIYLFTSIGRSILPPRAMLLYLLFAGGVLVLTIALGGLSVTYPPQFSYEYVATETGAGVYYSQGVSKFFGLAGIAAIFLAFSTPWRIMRLVLFGVCSGALGLSLIGGARGDSVAAALIVLAYLWYRSPSTLLIWLAAVSGTVVFLRHLIIFDDFIIFSRLISLQGDFGMRDILVQEAGALLAQQPICLTVGCGFGFFQAYYNYDSGVYPHNSALEGVIVWGMPAAILAAALVCCGLVTYLRRSSGRSDAFPLVYAYFTLLSLKSGTILGAWFVMAGSICFLAIALDELLWRRWRPARTEAVGTVDSRSGWY